MPFTPFHFGPGVAVHAAAPKYVSFLAFAAANVFTDVEPLYFMMTGQFPLHRFLHTYVGATFMWLAIAALFLGLRGFISAVLAALGWRQLNLTQVAAGAALGSYSHIVLDSIIHADIRPLAPFSDANVLYQLISLSALHVFCILAGVFGLFLLGVLHPIRRAK